MTKHVFLPLVLLSLAACGTSDNASYEYPVPAQGYESHLKRTGGSVLGGDGGLTIFGGPPTDESESGQGGPGITVNAFLWRASIDTVSFMPLASADPFGGIIITDWYQPPESPGERFKVNVFILTRDLRADGIRTAVFRQANQDGSWVDSPVDKQTATDLENAILKRARELRIASLN
jgi:hypothetical protein